MTKAVVHVRCNATGKIKRVKREGRETIILPSYAAKADTVLNGILYPKDELEASFAGLNRTPAPLGHPLINGKFVPALDPEALARNHVFAWNENARWDGERIALDVVIDEARAKESEGGRTVLNAIEKQEPISTSTGLLCNLGDPIGDGHDSVARDIHWDHVALLLDEEPAISTNEGVGIFVNSKQDATEIEVINSALEEAGRDLDWAVDHLARALERRERVPMLERMKTVLLEVFSTRSEPSTTEGNMDMDKEQFDALSAKVNGLAENAVTKDDLTNALTEAMKPLLDAQAEMKANQEAKDKADHEALVNKVVEAKIDGLGKDVAEKMDATALNALLTMHNAQNKKAAPLVSGFAINAGADEDTFSPLGWGAKQ